MANRFPFAVKVPVTVPPAFGRALFAVVVAELAVLLAAFAVVFAAFAVVLAELAVVLAELAVEVAALAWSYACFTLLADAGNVVDELLIELIILG